MSQNWIEKRLWSQKGAMKFIHQALQNIIANLPEREKKKNLKKKT